MLHEFGKHCEIPLSEVSSTIRFTESNGIRLTD